MIKELGELPIRILWQNDEEKQKAEKYQSKKLKRVNSKMLNKYMERDAEGKRVKRRLTNKNSIKMMTYLADIDAGINLADN